MDTKTQSQTVRNNAPVDTGELALNGHSTMDVGSFILTRYKTQMLPYIVYQEKGFTHYISGNFIDKNQFFIEQDTVGALNQIETMNSANNGGGATRHYSRQAKKRYNKNMIMSGAVSKIKR